jgi:hypothetical protein
LKKPLWCAGPMGVPSQCINHLWPAIGSPASTRVPAVEPIFISFYLQNHRISLLQEASFLSQEGENLHHCILFYHFYVKILLSPPATTDVFNIRTRSVIRSVPFAPWQMWDIRVFWGLRFKKNKKVQINKTKFLGNVRDQKEK